MSCNIVSTQSYSFYKQNTEKCQGPATLVKIKSKEFHTSSWNENEYQWLKKNNYVMKYAYFTLCKQCKKYLKRKNKTVTIAGSWHFFNTFFWTIIHTVRNRGKQYSSEK